MSSFKLFAIFLFSITTIAYSNEWVPCKTNPKYAYRIHLPKNYEVKKEKLFEALYIFDPGGNARFRGLESWADENDIVLIASRDNKNALESREKYHDIFKATVLSTEKEYRIHPMLKYTTGMSGGAMSAVDCANLFNKKFAGVLLHAHSGNGYRVPKHIAVSFYYGTKDKIHSASAVEGAIRFFEKQGNSVLAYKRDVGHKWATKEEFIELLDWMIKKQRFSYKFLTKKMKKDLLEELLAEIKPLLEQEAAEANKDKIPSLLSNSILMKTKEGKSLLKVYGSVLEKDINELGDDVSAFQYIDKLEKQPFVKKLPSNAKRALSKKVSQLKRTDLKKEFYAKQMYLKIKAAEAKAKSDKAKKSLLKSYKKVAGKYPGTIYGEKSLSIVTSAK